MLFVKVLITCIIILIVLFNYCSLVVAKRSDQEIEKYNKNDFYGKE